MRISRSTSESLGLRDKESQLYLNSIFFLLYSFLDVVIWLRQLYDQDRPKATGEMLDILEVSDELGKWKMFIDALKEAGKYRRSLCFIVNTCFYMVGKIFSRGHFEYFFFFFPENKL